MKKDHLANREYRYGCSIDCTGTPLRVYERTLGSQGSWNNYEDYMNSPTFVWYNHSGGGSSDYAWLPGHWMSDQEPPGEGSMFYQDAFGVALNIPTRHLPEYQLGGEEGSDFFPASVMSRIRDKICKFLPFFCRRKDSKPPTPWEYCDKLCAEKCTEDPDYKYPYIPPEDFYAGVPGMITIARYELPGRPHPGWSECYHRCVQRCLRHIDPPSETEPEPGRHVIYCTPMPSFPVSIPLPTPSPCPVFVF